ncbi:ECF transporter S component [[Acholeplasma] multilocale]|uniref:ECF transporter S component n=1 Tax=[Acholeplasma] multilocale TaxID=264638 RepID=UPI00047E5EDB|nr:ECF transporter S component [[Acholeplasma] multilocale]
MLNNELEQQKEIYSYKLWRHKFDFAEINKRNYHKIIRDYFKLSTKKITVLAMLLAIEVVLTAVTGNIMRLIPLNGFFVIEFSFFMILLILLATNLFYAMLIFLASTWMRMGITGAEPVGLIAMTITDGSFLLLFAFLIFLIKFFLVRTNNTREQNIKFIKYSNIVILFVMVIVVSGIGVLINWTFILSMYGIPDEASGAMLWPIFGFNILKYSLNAIIYMSMYKAMIGLVNIYKI